MNHPNTSTDNAGVAILPEPLRDEKTTAHVLGISPAMLVAGRFRGNPVLPFVKIGRRVLYRPSDIRAFIESNLHGAQAA